MGSKVFTVLSDKWIDMASNTELEEELLITSPYITGNTIIDVVRASSAKKMVATNLCVHSILSRSLDPDILIQLLENDVALFHVPRLHAKALITERMASIGSQNFTRAGQNLNREISVVIDTPSEIRRLRRWFTEIVTLGYRISKAEIEYFRKLVRNVTFDSSMDNQEYPEDSAYEAWLDDRSTRLSLPLKVPASAKTGKIQGPRVELVDVGYWADEDTDYRTYITLSSPGRRDVLNRFVTFIGSNPVVHQLPAQTRHLLVHASTGCLYFAPANKWQIGKFATSVSHKTHIALQRAWGKEFPALKFPFNSVDVILLNPRENKEGANILIDCDLRGQGWTVKRKFSYFFDGIEFVHLKSEVCDIKTMSNLESQILGTYADAISSFMTNFVDVFVLETFDFKKKMNGVNPDRIFTDDYYRLNLLERLCADGRLRYFLVLEGS